MKLLGQPQDIKILNLRQSHGPLTINDRARAFLVIRSLNKSGLSTSNEKVVRKKL